MAAEKDLYQQLLDKGFSKQEIHLAMHKFLLEEINYNKQRTAKKNLHPNFINRFLHKLNLYQLTGKALSLLKTQFAKKPKSPI